MKVIVGLTGGIGSGKSEVSRRFQALGIDVVDADDIARQVVQPDSPALNIIAAHFGHDVLLDDGTLNRAELRKIIFSTPGEKYWLENLLHPIIRIETTNQLTQAKSPYSILSSPLLLETNQYQLVQHILVVDADEHQQIDRAVARDGNSAEQIKHIMATQLSREERRARADDIIYNNGSIEALDEQVKQLHQNYLSMSK